MATKIVAPKAAAVLYLRMSSDKQEHSIEAQRSELAAYASKHDYQIVGEYLDEGISGDATDRRVGFLRMRDDAASGEFSVVLCWDQDRFGRFDPIEGGYWILPFRNAGVRLETIAQGKIDWTDFAGRLIYLVQQEGKHAYLRDLSRNVSRGLLAGAKAGRDGTGGRSPQGLQNDPDRAAIVQRIFADYLEPGASLRSVADGLNREGIFSQRGKPWTMSTVRYILRNKKYVGDYVRFRFRSGKYFSIRDGEIVSRTKADGIENGQPSIVIPDHHDAIVDRKTFARAQAKLDRQKRDTAPRTLRRYAFSGLLRCGDCGLAMCGQRGTSYCCHSYQNGGKGACFCNHVQERVILDVVVRMIEEKYVGKALDRLRGKLRKRLAAKRQADPAEARRLRKRIEDLDQQIDRGAERVFTAPEKLVPKLYAKLDDLREERDRLEERLSSLLSLSSRPDAEDKAGIEAAISALEDLGRTIREAEDEDRRELFRQIISKIELRFTHRDNGGRMRNKLTGGTIFLREDSSESSSLSRTLG